MSPARGSLSLVVALAAGVLACSGEPQRTGLGEPFTVRNGVFFEGELPGTAPDDAGVRAPSITAAESQGSLVTVGQAGKVYLGRATPEAYAIGLRLVGQGTGWWMVPVGGADPSFNNELTWQLTADFGGVIPTGIQRVRFVALDGVQRGGTQRDLRVCVLPAVPDNLHACDPSIAPPDTVISLSWDTDADLDLVVLTPEGRTVDARHPTTAAPEGTSVPAERLRDPSTGVLDRNSNAACALDRVRRENLVWQGTPGAGTWRVYVNLFDACRQTAARYRVGVWRRDARGEQVEVLRRDGLVTALAANGGASRGTFVADVNLP